MSCHHSHLSFFPSLSPQQPPANNYLSACKKTLYQCTRFTNHMGHFPCFALALLCIDHAHSAVTFTERESSGIVISSSGTNMICLVGRGDIWLLIKNNLMMKEVMLFTLESLLHCMFTRTQLEELPAGNGFKELDSPLFFYFALLRLISSRNPAV